MKVGDKWQRVGVVLAVLTAYAGGRAAAFDPNDWTPPASLVEVNSDYDDKAAFLSFDGLTLYLTRSLPWEYTRIFAATRGTGRTLWNPPLEIVGLTNPYANVDYPWVSADNLRLYYYSTESSWRRLRLAERESVAVPWSVGREIHELNRLGQVANPSLAQDELTIVFSGLGLPGGKGSWDLWMAGRPNRQAPFDDVVNLDAVNEVAADMHPYITPDGLTLYFASNRDEVFQIFEAKRASRQDPFGPPQRIDLFDALGGDTQYPRLSPDGTMFFAGVWTACGGSMDIYVAVKGKPGGNYIQLVRGGTAVQQQALCASTGSNPLE